MKIAQVYSHLNGLEFMLVRKPDLWQEIQDAVSKDKAAVEVQLGKYFSVQYDLTRHPDGD